MRVLLPDTVYHIYNYAVEEENLFRTDEQYIFFLKRYATYIHPVAKTYAYCLMPNHFHFLIKIRTRDEISKNLQRSEKEDTLASSVMQQFALLFNTYTKVYNRHYDRKGALFHSNTKSVAVQDKLQLPGLVHYIHQNPIHHQYCQTLNEWYWSSYHTYLNTKKTLLEKEETLEWFGGKESFNLAHRRSEALPTALTNPVY